MQINRIEIEHINQDPLSDMAAGMVALETQAGCVTVLCRVPKRLCITAGALHRRLATEALRQARRMPEYRSGQDQLTVAPGAFA